MLQIARIHADFFSQIVEIGFKTNLRFKSVGICDPDSYRDCGKEESSEAARY